MSADSSAPRGGSEALLAAAILAVLGIMIVPLPAALLDVLLAFNVGLSILMLLVSLGLKRPVEFSVFPSLLLITTLFRLSLNVATTRLILLRGGEGTGAAGHVIETFGRFAVGGSLIVGAVVFLILLVVNFGVITKGSGRVSEVAARFTLDALPGKQMSIDADLAAGAIDDKDAKARRGALERETEFFGAMDGASKFVRGDAVAGLAITAINIVGGLVAGLVRDHLSFSSAAETYTLLTVGDGLVSQLPALLVSTAAGILVTRAAGADLGSQMGGQVFGSPRILRYTSAVLGVLALLPGMPLLAFGSLAAGALLLSRRRAGQEVSAKTNNSKGEEPRQERIHDLLALDAIEVEVGYGLLPLIDLAKGGELPGRVTALRRQLATDLGIVLPSVHLRDNLRLDASTYRIRMRGVDIGQGIVHADRLMCLNSSGALPTLEGISGKDPAFGLAVRWIQPQSRAAAESQGFTVVDPASVVTTHLGEVLRRNAYELVGRQEVQELLGACSKQAPKLVEDVVPGVLTLGELVRVIRGLLREGVSVRDLRTILEAVADAATKSKDPVYLLEQTRRRLARQITAKISDGSGKVHALVLDRPTEELLRRTLGSSDGEAVLAPDLEVARRLIVALESRAAAMAASGKPVVLVSPPDLRKPLFDFGTRYVSDFWAITARELTPDTSLDPAGTIQLTSGAQAAA